MPKNENHDYFFFYFFLPKQKKVKEETAFQLSQGVSFGTLVFSFRALVPLLRLTSPRTATAFKTALTLYES